MDTDKLLTRAQKDLIKYLEDSGFLHKEWIRANPAKAIEILIEEGYIAP